MKAEAAPAPDKQAVVVPTGGKSMIWLIGGLALFAMLAIGLGSPSLLLFMIVGLAPTIGAAVIDKDPERHGAIAVGAMSLAAMIPLVLGQFTAKGGYTVLGDPFAWLKVYAAAGIGWAIHTTVPVVSVTMTDLKAEWRRRELLKIQEALVEEWGQEVVSKKRTS